MKYVQVDSDGYAWLHASAQNRLHKLGFAVGRANDEWVLFTLSKNGSATTVDAITFETADHILFDNYLKLILED